MPINSRKLSRGRGDNCGSQRAPHVANASTCTSIEAPSLPKHFPFPNTPVDGEFSFEVLMYFFAMCSAGLQYLHLYRSVWWLPHSYSSSTMNFYLIDGHLLTFILIVFSRRLIYSLGCFISQILDPPVTVRTGDELNYVYFRYALFAFFCAKLGICACFIVENQTKVSILYLCYPILVYLILFGCKIRPIFEGMTWCSDGKPPLHACSSNAIEIRKEAENLRNNFNDRLRQILFSAVVNAYYGGFIPCCFAQPQLQYDIFWVTQHAFFIFFASFIFATTHLLPLRYCDILHRSALHLGRWEKLETDRTLVIVTNDWREDCIWPSGVLVKHDKVIWRAKGHCNSSRPGDKGMAKFYNMFLIPAKLLSLLLFCHVVLIFYQLFLLVRITHWYKIVSLALMLFFNYYTLYKLCRDFLVSYKIYRGEKEMHDKTDYR
ncbi:transmembrane protein 39A-A isoform X2 [Cylas formicarius]|uniref:transmembrane protein 39A-A isoform X2 n=1 Tax=Cylas formicarius TaxID=197179 RepID=UPI002958DDDB|nr:transmembrane protein 39A-A isoform X2 [Cylas formicarius]XP_060526721.1 transmembrane protein 39A-A isoform X2 [Cylas formicarius]XP_060526722.1 transmembrane protein 39A-A isoform X2 [Cylas formicarius]XP_060526723.1 transmembrane protein 39A-A isoform X2 [Cylas formicarius]XP_060526724.1 transmembrane protein 39A-A isoform X2 [Cylas formicarius]